MVAIEPGNDRVTKGARVDGIFQCRSYYRFKVRLVPFDEERVGIPTCWFLGFMPV